MRQILVNHWYTRFKNESCIQVFLGSVPMFHLFLILFVVPSDTSSASEDEGSLRRKAALSAVLAQNLQSPDYWINRSVQSSSTSSSASSTLSHGEPKTQPQPQLQPAASLLADVLAHTRIGKLNSRMPQMMHTELRLIVALLYDTYCPFSSYRK